MNVLDGRPAQLKALFLEVMNKVDPVPPEEVAKVEGKLTLVSEALVRAFDILMTKP